MCWWVLGTEPRHSRIRRRPERYCPGKSNGEGPHPSLRLAELGGNISTSNHSNGPAGYELVPDTVDLNQVVLRTERVPDTSQADHPDWGFRFTQLFGTDYRYTTAKGFLSGQLLRNNRLYGYDIPEATVQFICRMSPTGC